MKIALTGTNGFLGTSIKLRLKSSGHFVVPITRCSRLSDDLHILPTAGQSDLYDPDQLYSCLSDVDVVIHVAGLAHQGSPNGAPFIDFYRANTLSAQQVANACKKVNVKHVVLISSISVNSTVSESPVTHRSLCAPTSYYAISKYLAESVFIDSLVSSRVSWTILRPPMIYGPSAPGSFSTIVNFASKYRFLPFGLFHFKRSMIHIDNISSIIDIKNFLSEKF